jgi:hypothetical protein
MDKFLEIDNLPPLNHEEMDTGSIAKYLQTKEKLRAKWLCQRFLLSIQKGINTNLS